MPERALHNHIFQVKPRRIRYVEPPCPACGSIDLNKMDRDYAYYWRLRLSKEAETERALRV